MHVSGERNPAPDPAPCRRSVPALSSLCNHTAAAVTANRLSCHPRAHPNLKHRPEQASTEVWKGPTDADIQIAGVSRRAGRLAGAPHAPKPRCRRGRGLPWPLVHRPRVCSANLWTRARGPPLVCVVTLPFRRLPCQGHSFQVTAL